MRRTILRDCWLLMATNFRTTTVLLSSIDVYARKMYEIDAFSEVRIIQLARKHKIYDTCQVRRDIFPKVVKIAHSNLYDLSFCGWPAL